MPLKKLKENKALFPGSSRATRKERPVISRNYSGAASGVVSNSGLSLKVMTLNAAHGRKNGPHQFFQTTEEIILNLNEIAAFVGREQPHVLALQEADGPSVWSGNFCHVEYLAQKSSYAFAIRGEHVRGMKVSYGTAILSSLEISDPLSVRFPPSLPLPSKGFTVCTVAWPGISNFQIDVCSVHLDCASKRVRRRQVEKLVESMEERTRPLVVMGDFNCEWGAGDSSLRLLVKELGLSAYRPEASDLFTYPRFRRRLDWVFVSQGLEFSTYNVFRDVLSDHLGVITEITLDPKIMTENDLSVVERFL
ncbi:MAG: endonuclease/exonuclease/phosphatase family protein [Deltaproteobacteria bacterium]|nr:endonuclease/exonuclease/phosphatase family protein [Deltaproteobacteria bacterium]